MNHLNFFVLCFLIQSAFQNMNADVPQEVQRQIEAHVLSNSWPRIYYDVLPKVIENKNFKSVVEIGVALGGHAEHLLKNSAIDIYYGIDPYLSDYDPDDGFNKDVIHYGLRNAQENWDYLYEWVKNTRLGSYQNRCQLIRKSSVEASLLFEDGSLDCVFIDGDHRYEAVLADLKVWWPKVKKGGMLLGDDYWMENVSHAVDDFFLAKNKPVCFILSNSGYVIWAVENTQEVQ